MQQKVQFTDITLNVDSKDFPAHLDILSAASDYFECIIGRDWLSDGANRSVPIYDIKSEAFAKLINATYTGDLQPTETDVVELYNVADFMTMPVFVEKCRQFICEGLKDESRSKKFAIIAMDILDNHNDDEIQEQFQFVLSNDITKHAGLFLVP